MSKYVNKTQPTNISPTEFVTNHVNQAIVPDCLELLTVFEKITGKKPVLWDKIIGFGKYHYQQKASQGDWFITGFAPRTSTIAIYVMGQVEQMDELGKKLGKFKKSGSCLHIKKLQDIDLDVLAQIIQKGMEYMQAKYEILE